MTVAPEEFLGYSPEQFLDQSPEDFLDQSPEDFLDTSQFSDGIDPEQAITAERRKRILLWIALALAAALYAHHRMMVARLRESQAESERSLRAAIKEAWPKTPLQAWQKIAIPAIMHAFRLGSTSSMTYEELEAISTAYARQMGDYVVETSTKALVEGFNAQLAAGWNPQVAAIRAKEAYGLDSNSMRQAMSSFVKGEAKGSGDLIPSAVRTLIDKLVMRRGEVLGSSEAYAAVQMAKALTWQFAYKSGDMPSDAMKMWVTARDERVCAVCGPLDRQTVAPDEYFTSGSEQYFAPGVHPRCRCRVEIVYSTQFQKAMPGDPYDRDRGGRFAHRESRRRTINIPRNQTKERVQDQEAARIIEELRAKIAQDRAAQSSLSDSSQELSSSTLSSSVLSSPSSQSLSSAESQSLSNASVELSSAQATSLSTSQQETELSSARDTRRIILLVRRQVAEDNLVPDDGDYSDYEETEVRAYLPYDTFAVSMRDAGMGMSVPRIAPGEVISFRSFKDYLEEDEKDISPDMRSSLLSRVSRFDPDDGHDEGLRRTLRKFNGLARKAQTEWESAKDVSSRSGRDMHRVYAYALELLEDQLPDIAAEDESLTDYDILSYYDPDAPPLERGDALRRRFANDMARDDDMREQYKIRIQEIPDHAANRLGIPADQLTEAMLNDWSIRAAEFSPVDDSSIGDGTMMPTVFRIQNPYAKGWVNRDTGGGSEQYLHMSASQLKNLADRNDFGGGPERDLYAELDPDAEYEVVSISEHSLHTNDALSDGVADNILMYRIVDLVPLA